jgi:choline-sulfatase
MPLSRRAFLSATGAQALAQSSRPTELIRRPNIVLFMPETVRAESVGCYGHPVVRTPNIDRLAQQGVRFTNCHVQNTVCGPSRCSLMTGWPVHVRGHRSLYYLLHQDEPNLFRYLKQNGYDVYWYGKNDLLTPDSFPSSVTDWDSRPPRVPPPHNPWPQTDPHYYSFLYGPGGDRRDTADYANVQAAFRVLERSEKPFCIFLPLAYAHPPFSAPAGFHDMYDPSKLPPLRPASLPRKPNFFEAIRRMRRLDRLSEADFRKIQAVYLGMISYSDWLLGELLEKIESTNHAGDTAVFLLSDHGEWGGDYGLVEKWPSAMDDALSHVPLVARVPGAAQGHVSHEIVELYDVMATCLELCGIRPQHTHFARSLVPQLQGAPGDPQRAAFCEGGYNRYEPQCFEPMADFSSPADIYYPKVALQNEHPETITRTTSIRTREYKLILRPDGQSELYDLRRDPRELHNVYGTKVYARQQEALRMRLLDWYVRTSDAAPYKQDRRGFPMKT